MDKPVTTFQLTKPDYDRLRLIEFQHDHIMNAIEKAMRFNGQEVMMDGAEFCMAFELISPCRYRSTVVRAKARYKKEKESEQCT